MEISRSTRKRTDRSLVEEVPEPLKSGRSYTPMPEADKEHATPLNKQERKENNKHSNVNALKNQLKQSLNSIGSYEKNITEFVNKIDHEKDIIRKALDKL